MPGHPDHEERPTRRRRRPRRTATRPADPRCDQTLMSLAAHAGIDVTDRDELLSAVSSALVDVLWHTPTFDHVWHGHPPTERARQMLPELSDSEADEIANWWWDEHHDQIDITRFDLPAVADTAELARIAQIVGRSRDGYGLADDVVWRHDAYTADAIWTLLDTTLGQHITEPGAHLTGGLTELVLNPVRDLLADPRRIFTCGAARIQVAELYGDDAAAAQRNDIDAAVTRLTGTSIMQGSRTTLWLLALRGAHTDPLRPPLPLWRHSLATLADQARNHHITDHIPAMDDAATATYPIVAPIAEQAHAAGGNATPQRWQWDAATLTTAKQRPWRLSGTHIHRLSLSATLTETAATITEQRNVRLGATGAHDTLEQFNLNLYV
jgi:hypothetical protein